MENQKMNIVNKLKFSIKNLGKYTREVSVVVIGVAITLFATLWISKQGEKRDMALNLKAIRMELAENARDVGYLIDRLQTDCRYTAYLRSHDKKSLNQDTLNSYFMFCYAAPANITFKTNSFEMFKSSGTMRLMNNKELLMKIWNVYDGLNILKELIDEHNKLKWDFIVKEVSLVDMDKEGKIERNIIPMYDFYKKTGASDNLLNVSEIILKNTQELHMELTMMQLDVSKLKAYKVTDEDLDKYVGIYSSELIPVKLTITKRNKQLFGQLTRQVPL